MLLDPVADTASGVQVWPRVEFSQQSTQSEHAWLGCEVALPALSVARPSLVAAISPLVKLASARICLEHSYLRSRIRKE